MPPGLKPGGSVKVFIKRFTLSAAAAGIYFGKIL